MSDWLFGCDCVSETDRHINRLRPNSLRRMQTFTSLFLSLRQYNVSKTDAFDPIPPVAAAIANKYTLICFDEFQVSE